MWEYKTLEANYMEEDREWTAGGVLFKSLADFLNHPSNKGWELVSLAPEDAVGTGGSWRIATYIAVFKRPTS